MQCPNVGVVCLAHYLRQTQVLKQRPAICADVKQRCACKMGGYIEESAMGVSAISGMLFVLTGVFLTLFFF